MHSLDVCFDCYCQDLTSQVSAETDPVALLPKVVSLLYIQVLSLDSMQVQQLL